ncbi:DNA-directed RNA polymerase subunit beta-beta protein [Hirschfeldia incana]|nr:DNA-directed RNA polymerase subunit beta-beta protein [Hirschfeldia incana]
MPLHTKIQPIDVSEDLPTMKQMPKSRLKRLFERQFSIKNTTTTTSERLFTVVPPPLSRGSSGDLEPSSVCLAKMVVNFIEGNNNNKEEEEKQRCGRIRCSCFTGSGTESSAEDESDDLKCSSGEACVMLKSLVLCTSICERNLMADVTKIVETTSKRKDQCYGLKNLVSVLVSLGHDAAICKSRWEKSPSYPAGEYEYVDVIIEGERLLIDIDFKSNFEIARATKTYKSILQTLPSIFVGKADRLQRIILFLARAAKQSLKKRGLHVPPWRREEYVKSKWLSTYVRGEDKQETVDMLSASVGSIVFGV